MKRIFSFILSCMLLLGMVGCAKQKMPQQPNTDTDTASVSDTTGQKDTPTDWAYEALVVYAGSSSTDLIYTMSLNREKTGWGADKELPIYRLDQQKDVAWFYENFGNAFSLTYENEYQQSFQQAISKYGASFYKDNSLMLTYIYAGSGSYQFGVRDVLCENQHFSISVEQTNDPETGTCDMAGWFLIVAVPDAIVDGCTEFGAFYVGH